MGISSPFASEISSLCFWSYRHSILSVLQAHLGLPNYGARSVRHWVYCVSKLLELKSRTFNYRR